MRSVAPLRVVYITHTGVSGGSGRSLRLLIENLPRGSVEALVICPPGPAVECFRSAGARVCTIPGVPIISSLVGATLRGMRSLSLLREIWHMRHGAELHHLIGEFQPDIVHLNERGLWQGVRIAGRMGIPIVMHARSLADHSNRWVNRLDAKFAKYITKVVAIDECVRRTLRGYSDCEVIHNPLPFQPVESKATGRKGESVTVTFLSGMLAFKGVWDLLEAARLLKERRDIVFRVYGENSRPPEFLRSWFGRACSMLGLARDVEGEARAFVTRHGLQTTVQLLGNVTPDAKLFQATDILAFPSHLNGVGRSVFEAGVFGVPSVVALEDPISDIVEDGVTGLIVKPRDPKGLAEAIRRLADDANLRRNLGENARRKYAVQFDPIKIGEQMLGLYQTVLRERGTAIASKLLRPMAELESLPRRSA